MHRLFRTRLIPITTHRFYTPPRTTIHVPTLADSIKEGVLGPFEHPVGSLVQQDATVVSIETDKIGIPVNAPVTGVLVQVFAKEGETVEVGQKLFELDTDAQADKAEKSPEKVEKNVEKSVEKPVESKPVQATSVEATSVESKPAPAPNASKQAPAAPAPTAVTVPANQRTETRIKLSPMRLRIAERLKESQNTAASLTTFNEIDMTELISLRKTFKDEVQEKHGIKFGFMSPFIKASAKVLSQEQLSLNGRIEGNELVHHSYVDVSVAVATPKGLVTPVLRNVESKSLIEIEQELAQLSEKARQNKLALEDLAGGTFTISNGGVFGSLMGTPILNTPQSGILGMHAIKDRAVVVNGKVEVRPVMVVALTYDHRVVDGREAVSFLVRLKALLEDPRRFLLDL